MRYHNTPCQTGITTRIVAPRPLLSAEAVARHRPATCAPVSSVGTSSRPPKWIKPQLTRLVEEAPAGGGWLHEIDLDAVNDRLSFGSCKPYHELFVVSVERNGAPSFLIDGNQIESHAPFTESLGKARRSSCHLIHGSKACIRPDRFGQAAASPYERPSHCALGDLCRRPAAPGPRGSGLRSTRWGGEARALFLLKKPSPITATSRPNAGRTSSEFDHQINDPPELAAKENEALRWCNRHL